VGETLHQLPGKDRTRAAVESGTRNSDNQAAKFSPFQIIQVLLRSLLPTGYVILLYSDERAEPTGAGFPRLDDRSERRAGERVVPSGCRICEKLLTGSSRVPICDECLGSFRRMPEEVCRVCGWPVQASFAGASIGSADGGPEDKTRQACAVCASRDLGFDCARTFGVYEGALVRAIIMLKFERMSRWELGLVVGWLRCAKMTIASRLTSWYRYRFIDNARGGTRVQSG
jgi:hypothetical protein